MIITGKNSVLENLRNGKTFNKIQIAKGTFGNNEIINLAKQNGIKLEFVERSIMDKKFKSNQGVIADITDFEYSQPEDIINNSEVVVVLDGIEDPHNLGAIIRSCECAGVNGIFIPKHRAVAVNDTVIKTSAGATANVNVAMVTNLNQLIEQLKQNGFWVYGCETGGQNLYQSKLTGKTAFVIGSEGKGISKLTLSKCDEVLSIPLLGKINSLNASVACSVVLYEYVRQNQK